MPPIRVLLDISTLGAAANPHQRATQGIFRVVEHTARALTGAPDVRAWFHARQNHAASQRHFEAHFAKVHGGPAARFAEPALPTVLGAALSRTEKFLSEQYVHPPWSWGASGRALWAANRLGLRGVRREVAERLDVYHSPVGEPPEWTRRFPRLHRFTTVYDLIPLIHPEFFSPGSVRHALRALKNIGPEDWVLCISESTRRDLLERCPRCDPAKALVTLLAAESFFHPELDAEKIAAVRRCHGIPEGAPYFLSVCTLEPRKNLEVVIAAFTEMIRQAPAGEEVNLVLVGGAGWGAEFIKQAIATRSELRGRVNLTGYVPDEDLAALYSGALAFVYMSLYEGFGLPPLEAMQCGVPVIVSNLSSLPEVVGEAGILLSPTDRDGLAAAMHELCADDALRGRLAASGLARAAGFRWERFRREVLGAYRQALA